MCKQSREEMEVLFTLLAERYERASVLLTSNLAFSEVGSDIQDAMDEPQRHRPLGATTVWISS